MALISAQSKIPASASAFGKRKISQFNPGQEIQSVRFVSADGSVSHWASFPSEQARQFELGTPVNLVPAIRKGKDGDRQSFDIEVLDLPAAPQMPHQQHQRPLGFRASPEQSYSQPISHQQPTGPVAQAGPDKAAIAQWITGQAKLYSYCYSQALAALPDGVPDAAVQGGASTLYISACRKFRLES